jgi:hypothetical protein
MMVYQKLVRSGTGDDVFEISKLLPGLFKRGAITNYGDVLSLPVRP